MLLREPTKALPMRSALSSNASHSSLLRVTDTVPCPNLPGRIDADMLVRRWPAKFSPSSRQEPDGPCPCGTAQGLRTAPVKQGVSTKMCSQTCAWSPWARSRIHGDSGRGAMRLTRALARSWGLQQRSMAGKSAQIRAADASFSGGRSRSCGIVGAPNIGKSTLFNAMTATQAAQAANYPFCTIDPNVGRVHSPPDWQRSVSFTSSVRRRLL
jgi:hypothetical protein